MDGQRRQEHPEDHDERDGSADEHHDDLGSSDDLADPRQLFPHRHRRVGSACRQYPPREERHHQAESVGSERQPPAREVGEHAADRREDCETDRQEGCVATDQPGSVEARPVVADQDHRQVDQSCRAHAHAESGDDEEGEARSQRCGDTRDAEHREAGNEYSASAEAIREHTDDRRHEDPGERRRCDQQSCAAVADAELVENVRHRRSEQRVAHDSGSGHRQDEEEERPTVDHRTNLATSTVIPGGQRSPIYARRSQGDESPISETRTTP